jgi:hypothetical protein
VESWRVAVLMLVAGLVGALIPVLLQLRATLRAAEMALKETIPRIEETLLDLRRLMLEVSEVVEGLQSTTRVVGAISAAIGPAVAAGLRSYRSAHAEPNEEQSDEQRTRFDGGA